MKSTAHRARQQSAAIPGLLGARRTEPLPRRNLVIFDGTCGFCTWSVMLLDRQLGVRVASIPAQWLTDAELVGLGTSRAACAEAVVFVDASGVPSSGADAVNALLRAHPLFGAPVALALRVPALLRFERSWYRWIARHRVAISRLLRTRRYALIGEGDSAS